MIDDRGGEADRGGQADRPGSRSRRSTVARGSKARKVSAKKSAAAKTGRFVGGSALVGRYGRTIKKSVTLRETIAEEIEARTGARGFSQFLDAAAERYLALLKAQEIVDDHVERHGQFTEEELAEAAAAWRGE
jgi:hypothetical protein